MTLKYDLRHEQVKHLDLKKFTTVDSAETVSATVKKMRAGGFNCALITENEELVGIFTDRDVLRKVVTNPDTWNSPISIVMSTSPITVNANDPAEVGLTLMNERHFRNVPVLDANNKIIGNLTHYAIIKYLADHFPESVYNLPPDPDRVSDDRVGA